MKPIPFWSDEIRICVEEATEREVIGKAMRLRDFVGEDRAALWEHENGELECRCAGHFIKGPEAY